MSYQEAGKNVESEIESQTATPLSEEVEDLKKAALELNRDLLILEEELLFPANSQIVVFLSLDVGKYFALDSVKLLIDDKLMASHLYTRRQNTALALGGIQRLYLGNLKSGDHEVTAFFVGVGPNNREYKRGATIVIDKDDDPKLLELKVRDSSVNMQPEFEFEEWLL
ncbi:MAG: AraC family transcriptional regulator [Agarilytica sp.]